MRCDLAHFDHLDFTEILDLTVAKSVNYYLTNLV